ncbi:lysophospholipid acyltransferase family protein [Kitasatospora sp. NPDC057015]|uniref:lysophospholipid acyltransferase family protein n=1 Tax=Kitasatospora sp. NPDC057015 TaxID=3346001 RepID=UPI00363CE4A2
MSAWLPTAPCTPEACVSGSVATVPVPRRVLRCAVLAAVLAVGFALAPVLARPGRAGAGAHAGPEAPPRELPAERLMRGWTRLLVAALGVRISAAVPPRSASAGVGPGALLVANHVSWLDILLIGALRPGRMLAKTEVRGWPLFGRLAAGIGTIFIERDRLRALPRTVEEVAAALRRGEDVVVFPEGSTWCGRGGGRFRPAAFQAALGAGAPVQPVVIRYRLAGGEPTTAPAFVGDDGLLASVWRVAGVRGLVAEVTLLPEIPAGRHLERRALARAAQASVQGRPGRPHPGHLHPGHVHPGHPEPAHSQPGQSNPGHPHPGHPQPRRLAGHPS